MPELPEVETIKRGLSPLVFEKKIARVEVRCRQLRWPIPDDFEQRVCDQVIQQVLRRGKYLLFQMSHETMLVHLGMSGRLCFLDRNRVYGTHDHVEIVFSNEERLRYTDPRRFGCILLTDVPSIHPLLQKLGVEPLSSALTPEFLMNGVKNRSVAIKSLLMNGQFIVGIGNIYAAEILFLAKIHPLMPSNQLQFDQANRLVSCIQQVLTDAIQQGGTTLKDFVNSEGSPGYFSQRLQVYGRAGQSCFLCDNILQSVVLGQRSTVFCGKCQEM